MKGLEPVLRPYDFNPRSPWGERPARPSRLSGCNLFQSTLPVGGATRSNVQFGEGGAGTFQSTLPVGGATNTGEKAVEIIAISIHAPRGGSDTRGLINHNKHLNFNPRSPWGERQRDCQLFLKRVRISIHAPRGGSDCRKSLMLSKICLFQSTLPVGGATVQITGTVGRT